MFDFEKGPENPLQKGHDEAAEDQWEKEHRKNKEAGTGEYDTSELDKAGLEPPTSSGNTIEARTPARSPLEGTRRKAEMEGELNERLEESPLKDATLEEKDGDEK